MTLFGNHSLEEHTDSLAHYLPGGRLFEARFVDGTNLRKFLRALAAELERYHTLLEDVASDYDIRRTQNLIGLWESALGIPGTCFDNAGTIEERRRNVLIKLTGLHGTTVQDYIKLANLLGYNVKVEPARPHGAFGMAFPIYFFSTGPNVLFTMVITLPIANQSSGFPLSFPVKFSNPDNPLLVCLFNRLKPAYSRVVYRYSS